ncbi:MAG: hypothetical protein KA533_03070 [Sphingobium sp.]|nr:hypothetical protein [Sphingobium sp.]MBP6110859.1 hypothetical protein [Sphingobium sp.]MBP8669997.1 hypothetical protein [Sphingobium sp.]MBP9157138.1 hypothetical protein [Sphingobium sp.]MCC6481087.1 hypothetical protein [Sphingomonadaceae bacterium]
MKIRRTNSFGEAPRRRSPVPMGCLLLAILVLGALGWTWHQGGEQPLVRVEKPVPADKLGH